jgi:hypothetical protein
VNLTFGAIFKSATLTLKFYCDIPRNGASTFQGCSRDVFFEEVYSDRLFVVSREDALAVALYHARLAHGTVAHNHNL